MNTLPPLQQSCGTLTLEKQPDTIHNMLEALHQRLAVLGAWKATDERPRRRAERATNDRSRRTFRTTTGM